MRTLILLVAFITLSGCNTATPEAEAPAAPATSGDSQPQTSSDDAAKYTFHRDVAFTDVTKTMPEGSVDHIDFNMATAPNVVVVVTVSATRRDGLSFTTTFTGDGALSIRKEWAPASSGDGDEHVGLFVLPAAVNAGHTEIN